MYSRKLGGFLVIALACVVGIGHARSPDETIPTARLPAEAHQTLRLIETGGPFPHKRDGIAFGNYEQRLPLRERGYYREYTVRTPGVKHRGARRIVCGGARPQRPDACYYTADHYRSFRRIAEPDAR